MKPLKTNDTLNDTLKSMNDTLKQILNKLKDLESKIQTIESNTKDKLEYQDSIFKIKHF